MLTTVPSPRRPLALVAAATTALLALSACSSGSEPAPQASSSAPASASSSPTPDIEVPDGVKLTSFGTQLDYGQPASVVVEPDQNSGSVLTMTVSGVTEGRISDFNAYVLSKKDKSATPYYADVTVTNEGPDPLGGVAVPLFATIGDNTLLESSTFLTPFKKCPSTALPKTFAPQDEEKTCLVFLVPDGNTLQGVAFAQSGSDPIRWTGDVATPSPAPKKKSGKKG